MKEAVVEKDGLELGQDVLSMRAENVNALSAILSKVLGPKGNEEERKHIIVLDRIDRQREATPILLAGLARLGERVRYTTPPN